MALSYTQYSGNGVTRQFAVPFKYLSKAHVGVTVNGSTVAFTWLSPTLVQTTTAPVNGTVVEVRRTTPRDHILVDFVDGSTLTETDLDTAALQTFFLAQEAFDAAGGTLSVNADGSFSALNRRITNVANPVADQDAVTKKWALDTANTNVSAAVAAKVSAETARDTATTKATDAGNSATAAATRKTEAEAARDAAVTAKGGAETARDGAVSAKNAAEAAKTGAEAALGTLGNEVTLAQTARTGAEAARDTAVSSRDSAIAAKTTAVDSGLAAVAAKNIAETKAIEATNARDTAVTKATDATQARDLAVTAKDLAQKWAFGPINTDVDGANTRSALHYATYCSNAWADVTTKAAQVSTDKDTTVTAKDAAVAAKVAAQQAAADAASIVNSNASAIVVTPSGNLTQTNVQAALVAHQTSIDSALQSVKPNLFVNPMMMFAQEWGNSVQNVVGGVGPRYVTDQWPIENGSIYGGYPKAQQVSVVTPNGGRHRLRIDSVVADANVYANKFLIVRQPMEGLRVSTLAWGTSNAKSIVVRFGVRTNLSGTYPIFIRNANTDRHYVTYFTIAAGEVNTDVARAVLIPGDTIGTWPTGSSLSWEIGIALSAGSNLQEASVGTWAAGHKIGLAGAVDFLQYNNASFELFDCGMYEGTQLPRFTPPDPVADVAFCQRYFRRFVLRGTFNANAGGEYFTLIACPAPSMRIAPSVTIDAPFYDQNNSAGYGAYGLGAGEAIQFFWYSNAAGISVASATLTINARM